MTVASYLKFRTSAPQYWNQWLVILVSFSLVLLIGWMDYATGWEWSLFTIYSLPIALVVWKVNGRVGFVFALLCAFVWWLAILGNNPYHSNLGLASAVVSRLFYFVIFSITAAILKDQREQGLARIERLERAQVLEQRILQVSEREQQKIGHDLHDNLGPHLAAIGYAARFLENDLRQRELPEAAQAAKIRELISDAMNITRDLAHEIFPVQMEGDGLSLALEALACNKTRETDLVIAYSGTGDEMINNPEFSMQLYRIAQEAVINVTKHAGAKKVTITLDNKVNSLCLVVADDGKGITPSANARQGMGLHSMRYRARLLGGELRIESSPNVGTVITCEIPKPFKQIKKLTS